MGIRLRRYQGIDLETFDKDRPLLTKRSEFKKAARQVTDTTFLRRIYFARPTSLTLNELLRWADEEFAAIAELAGGTVVKHTWGLYDRRGTNVPKIHMADHGLPRKHVLAAEVTIVDGQGLSVDQQDIVTQGVQTYLQGRASFLTDIAHRQFMHGVQRDQSALAPQPILLDLDVLYKE